MRRLTMSKVSLAQKCVSWLRDDFAAWDTTESPSARLGKAVHRYAEDFTNGGTQALDAYEKEFSLRPAQRRDFRLMSAAWLDWASNRVVPSRATPELKLDYDPINRVAKPRAKGKECPPGWIPGVADLVQPEPDGSIWLTDIKTGFWVPPAEDSAQLHSLAVAYAAFDPKPEVIRTAFVRVGKETAYETPRATRTRFQLDVFADSLEDLAADIAKEEQHEATPQPGAHCKGEWCPSRKGCEAFARYEAEQLLARAEQGAA